MCVKSRFALLELFQLLFGPGIIGTEFKNLPVVSHRFVHIAVSLMRHRENVAGPARGRTIDFEIQLAGNRIQTRTD